MSVTEPAGAISTLAEGQFADAKFSSDGSLLYAVSGNSIDVIDVASGAVLTQFAVGTELGGFDLSQDGRFLAVVETQTDGSTGTIYRVDLTNGNISTYSISISS